jgi:hypothetical protein
MDRMPGGAQSHLMLCSDKNLYVVKFQNNPQHLRVLSNELLASRLARELGLTVPDCEVVEVADWLIEQTEELDIGIRGGRERCRSGLHFGSRFVGGLMPGRVVDYPDQEVLLDLTNLQEFAGMLALDKWTGNIDGRQAVFAKGSRETRFTAYFIDQGFCFNAGKWRFEDAPLRGVYYERCVYSHVDGWNSFEPWLSRIESMDSEKIWRIAKHVPPEWTCGEGQTLDGLVEQLVRRRTLVRELIADFRDTSRSPFPKWSAALDDALDRNQRT